MFLKEYKIEDINYINLLKQEVVENIDKHHSYTTNVKGKMTYWKFFTHQSKNFEKVRDVLYEYHIYEAWGNILNKDDYVDKHNHIADHENFPVTASGVLYLTDVGPGTSFVDFDKIIKSEIGKIIVFSPKYNHLVEKYDGDKDRITIAFNGRIKEKYEF
tara:strand:- start:703 stop:1179 length:477 start_codon:yes stop_codon:yes gene_type:complete